MKHTLEGLKYTNRAIASYQGIYDSTREQIKDMGYTGDAMGRLNEYTSRMIEEERTYYNYWHDLITKIEDDRYRDILTMRYLEDRTVEEVAEELFYSVRYTAQLINQAIKAFERIHSKAYSTEFISLTGIHTLENATDAIR